jgi:Flp pilus assembly protein protease CpaA
MVNASITALIVGLTLHISIFDLRFHRIQNASIIILGHLLTFSMHRLAILPMLIGLFVLWICGLIGNVGMGDLKLLTILIVLQGEILLQSNAIVLSLLIASLSVLLHLSSRRTLKGEIALAPAILIPFTSVYLAL